MGLNDGSSMMRNPNSRSRRRRRSEPKRLAHPVGTLIVGIIGLVFFGGIAVLSNVFPNKTVTWLTTTAFIAFALLAVAVIAEYFFARHEVSDEGLRYGGMTGRRGYLRWKDLRSVKYVSVMQWFRLETQSGDVARVSSMLMGLRAFARLLLANTPPHAIDPKTLQILQETAGRNYHSVWDE